MIQRRLAPLLLAGCSLAFAGEQPVPLSRLFPGVTGQGNAVMDMGGHGTVALVGAIDGNVVASIRRIGSARVPIRTLYIDSIGGDIMSAIDLALYLREQRVHVVVAGRCFSACANYVFTGAVTKSVLPGSLVAIHGLRYQYHGADGMTEAGGIDAAKKLQAVDAGAPARLAAIVHREQAFYRQVGIDQSHHQAFARYEQARQGRKASAACPAIELWALGKADFDAMAIHGLREVWTPGTADEARSTGRDLGLTPATLYFGSKGNLERLCGGKPTGSLGAFLTSLFH